MTEQEEFDQYLEALADHEHEWIVSSLTSRERLIMYAGARLNWMGDFLGNPDIVYEKVDIPVEQILFTGTNLGWNKVLLDQCERSVKKFQALIAQDEALREQFSKEASFTKEPLLLLGPNEDGYYKVFDGLHRFVGAVIEQQETVTAYVVHEKEMPLPICETHTVYDLIRGFERHAKDEEGETELYHALTLLMRTYANVKILLEERFNEKYVADEAVQRVIKKVLRNTV